MKKKLCFNCHGSQSDCKFCTTLKILKEFKIPYKKKNSAHRTPERLYEYSKSLKERGIEVVIVGAGGAAIFREC